MPSLITTILQLGVLLIRPTSAFIRMSCPGRLLTERIDPIISPGIVSGHVHQVAGGNAFNYSMTYAEARASECSSCSITADLSNYWTPILYWHGNNGSFIRVPQAGDGQGVEGGMTVYYLQRPGPHNDRLKAFPAGFRMTAGNPFKRSTDNSFASQAVSFVCLDYDGNGQGDYTAGLPTKNCPDGVRAQVFFPACWDGKRLQSSDNSHVSYPATGAYNDGACPSSHPVHLISIFYEVIFQTDLFANDWNDGKQPFVFSMGDKTGYGFHGDFFNGWDVSTLQKIVDTCTNDSGSLSDCAVLDKITYTVQQSQACQIPPSVHEDVNGPLTKLPGCNPVTSGPANAKPVTNCAVTQIGTPETDYVDVTKSHKWKYVGCGNDSVSARTFTGTNTYASDMTVQSCIKYCAGYTYAGLEYSSQCYCGNTLPADRAPAEGYYGVCGMPCTGDSSQTCGGADALSIYKACGSGSCKNAVFSAADERIEASSSRKATSSSSHKKTSTSSHKASTSSHRPTSSTHKTTTSTHRSSSTHKTTSSSHTTSTTTHHASSSSHHTSSASVQGPQTVTVTEFVTVSPSTQSDSSASTSATTSAHAKRAAHLHEHGHLGQMHNH